MKTLVTVLITVGIFSITSAQSFIPKELINPQLNLDQKDTSGIISEGFQSTNPLNDSVLKYKLPNREWNLGTQKKAAVEPFVFDPYRMPILGMNTRPSSNMPVWIPDSTVNYALQIKKVGTTLYSGKGAVPDSVLIKNGFKR